MTSGNDKHPAVARARVEGAFVALAAGDALGWPQEFNSRPHHVQPTSVFSDWERRGGGRFYPHTEIIRAGEYSDDTQLTLAIARSRLTASSSWWTYFTRNELPLWTIYERGGGGATKRAANSWLRGVAPWKQTTPEAVARYFEAGGNGVAMRVVPHAVFYAEEDDPSVLMKDVVADGAATHGHPRALVGAAVYAYAAWWLLRTQHTVGFGELLTILLEATSTWGAPPAVSSTRGGWLEAANNTLRDFDKLWNNVVKEMRQLLELGLKGLENGVLSDDDAILERMGAFSREKGSGTVSAASAIYLAARHAAQPAQGVLRAAFAFGSDTDTIAAMTGGLLGALAGSDWLPSEWSLVQDNQYLRQIANKVAARATPQGATPEHLVVSAEAVESFVESLVAGQQGYIDFGGTRQARIVDHYRLKPATPSINVAGWQLVTSDGQTLYVTKIGKNSGEEMVQDASRQPLEPLATRPPRTRERSEIRIGRENPRRGDEDAVRTNFVLVDVDNALIDVGTLAPYDKDRHHALESAHGNDYIFRRRGDSLEVVPIRSNEALPDMKFEKRPVHKIGKLLNLIIERGFERHIIMPKIALVRRRPLTVVSLEPKNDLANTLFGRRSQGRFPLHVRRGFRIETRTLYCKAGPAPALVIDAITHSDLGDATCADLIADGFDLRGLYVLSLMPEDAKHGRPTIVGQVLRVEGTMVYLGPDRRGDRALYEASTLSLDLGPAALPRLAEHYISAEAHEELWDERNLLATGSQRWDRISRFVKRLSEGNFEIAPGVTARLSGWVTGPELGQTAASLPTYIVGGNKRADSTVGLFKSGPVFVPPSAQVNVRACVICERSLRHEVEQFLKALSCGEGSHRPLTNTWKIGAVSFVIFDAASSSASDYEQAFRSAIDDGTKWQLAFVQVPRDTQNALGDNNPYLVTKAKFLARNIPVQEFRVETINKPTSQRQWALGGIGLQVFAKLGGIPWLLQTKTRAHELILGLGSASLGNSRCGARDRVVGLTTAFSGDGRYYLTEASRTVKYEEHESAVVESAITAFRRVRAEMAWRPGDAVRIVLHSFKDLRKQHIEALKGAVLAVAGTELKVDFAFLHLAEQHPVLLFDPKEKQQIPQRGVVVRMGHYEALVTVLGPSEVRNDRIGFPRPVYMKLQQGSTFTDLDYLSEQVLAFSALSWRNFTPTSAPVTVLYAELIAGLIGRLGSLSRWDPDILRGDVGTSRWFL